MTGVRVKQSKCNCLYIPDKLFDYFRRNSQISLKGQPVSIPTRTLLTRLPTVFVSKKIPSPQQGFDGRYESLN